MKVFATLDWRRAVTAVVALFLALGCGYLMQNVLASDHPIATVGDEPDAAPVLRESEPDDNLPVPPAATLVPLKIDAPIMPERAKESEEIWHEASADCSPSLVVTNQPAAMLKVTLRAPCAKQNMVRLRHDKLEFDLTTDANGALSVHVPALLEEAIVHLDIEDITVTAKTRMDDASLFRRVAILSDGPEMLDLHAFEFGAQRNQFGHVWAGSPKSIDRAIKGMGGFLTRLGDGSGQMATIYTFPAKPTSQKGVVRLIVEADVTEETCSQVLQATALQTGPFGQLSATEVELKMPGCDAVGQKVELKNLLHDMRLASR